MPKKLIFTSPHETTYQPPKVVASTLTAMVSRRVFNTGTDGNTTVTVEIMLLDSDDVVRGRLGPFTEALPGSWVETLDSMDVKILNYVANRKKRNPASTEEEPLEDLTPHAGTVEDA